MTEERTRRELLSTLKLLEDEADYVRETRMTLLRRLEDLNKEIFRIHRHLRALEREEESA